MHNVALIFTAVSVLTIAMADQETSMNTGNKSPFNLDVLASVAGLFRKLL